jgi:hypothetical protein
MDNVKFVMMTPEYKSYVRVTSDFKVATTDPVPNVWVRFWYKVLLGWTWEKYNELK